LTQFQAFYDDTHLKKHQKSDFNRACRFIFNKLPGLIYGG